MTGSTTVFPELHQMIMGGSHLFLHIIMTAEAGIDANRDVLAFVAIIATFGIRWMQHVFDHARTITAMGTVTGNAVFHFHGEVGMFLSDQLGRVALPAQFLHRFSQ